MPASGSWAAALRGRWAARLLRSITMAGQRGWDTRHHAQTERGSSWQRLTGACPHGATAPPAAAVLGLGRAPTSAEQRGCRSRRRSPCCDLEALDCAAGAAPASERQRQPAGQPRWQRNQQRLAWHCRADGVDSQPAGQARPRPARRDVPPPRHERVSGWSAVPAAAALKVPGRWGVAAVHEFALACHTALCSSAPAALVRWCDAELEGAVSTTAIHTLSPLSLIHRLTSSGASRGYPKSFIT